MQNAHLSEFYASSKSKGGAEHCKRVFTEGVFIEFILCLSSIFPVRHWSKISWKNAANWSMIVEAGGYRL